MDWVACTRARLKTSLASHCCEGVQLSVMPAFECLPKPVHRPNLWLPNFPTPEHKCTALFDAVRLLPEAPRRATRSQVVLFGSCVTLLEHSALPRGPEWSLVQHSAACFIPCCTFGFHLNVDIGSPLLFQILVQCHDAYHPAVHSRVTHSFDGILY